MFSRTRLLVSLLTFALITAGCSRKERPALERLAILPLENLTPDVQLDWMSRASASVLATELSGSPHIQPVEITARRDAGTVRATALLQGYIQVVNGQLRLQSVLREVSTNRTLRTVEAAGPASNGLIPLVDALARQISTTPRSYSTANNTALREYILGISAATPEERTAHLNAAMSADPRFASPYIAQIESMIARGDAAGARDAVERAHTASSHFPPVDQARLKLFAAALNNDAAGRLRATAELARLQPGDLEIRKTLAELYLARKDFKGAVQALEEASRISPTDVGTWNALGYAYAYTGDVNGASRAFGQYRQLAPADANALDSLAEVMFYTGNFAEAEKNFLEAHAKNPQQFAGIELYRAALSRALTGDLAKADELFQRYTDFRKQDPAIQLQAAVWQYQTGRKKEALAAAEKFAETVPSKDLQSVAHSQLVFWLLDAGDRTRARAEALSAAQTSASPQPRSLAVVSAFLSMPSVPASEWKSRAERLGLNAAQSRAKFQLLGAALVFDGKYAEAVEPWKSLYDVSSPAGSTDAPVFLAWSYLKSGRTAEAQAIIRRGIIPPRTPDPGLDALAVAKFIEMRRQFDKK